MVRLDVNGKVHRLDIPEDMSLLWTVRDMLNMTGTKFGCGMGLCGACTIHIDGQPTRPTDAILHHASVRCGRQADHDYRGCRDHRSGRRSAARVARP
jgi:aerobic-type carbon monoxide dehydrogenase small subunit (CoxS/CutS family)